MDITCTNDYLKIAVSLKITANDIDVNILNSQSPQDEHN